MDSESTSSNGIAVRLARVDENVKRLMELVPVVKALEEKAILNEKEHQSIKWFLGILAIPLMTLILKKVGITI